MPMRLDRIEPTECRKHLERILSDPGPRSHLERERKKYASARRAMAIVQVVPEVAADRVGLGRLFEPVDMVRQRRVEQAAKCSDGRPVWQRLAGPCIRIPESIDEAETGVTIDCDRKG